MPSLEEQLAALEGRVGEAQKAAKALGSLLSRIKTAAETGSIADIERGLSQLPQRADEIRQTAQIVSSHWDFDARAHLEDGFLDELSAAAERAGVKLVHRDGRLSMFPYLLKLEAKELRLRIGKRLEKRLRPSVLARLLAELRSRPVRLGEERFLNLLYRAYRHLCGSAYDQQTARGPLKPVVDLHEVLTLFPSVDYPPDEFGRDLLLLDRRPELRTQDGARPVFEGAALARQRVQRIHVYDEHGMQKTYIAVRFVRED